MGLGHLSKVVAENNVSRGNVLLKRCVLAQQYLDIMISETGSRVRLTNPVALGRGLSADRAGVLVEERAALQAQTEEGRPALRNRSVALDRFGKRWDPFDSRRVLDAPIVSEHEAAFKTHAVLEQHRIQWKPIFEHVHLDFDRTKADACIPRWVRDRGPPRLRIPTSFDIENFLRVARGVASGPDGFPYAGCRAAGCRGADTLCEVAIALASGSLPDPASNAALGVFPPKGPPPSPRMMCTNSCGPAKRFALSPLNPSITEPSQGPPIGVPGNRLLVWHALLKMDLSGNVSSTETLWIWMLGLGRSRCLRGPVRIFCYRWCWPSMLVRLSLR